MKKIVLSVLMLFCIAVSAQVQPVSNALRLDQRNAANTSYVSRFVPPAAIGSCMVTMNGADQSATPICYPLGAAFSISNGAINVPVTTGPQGPIGPQGPEGIQGFPGVDGAQGPQGPMGPAGAEGAVGATGATGPQGPAGPQGVAGPIGATGAQGPAGPQGLAGAKGDKGDTGAQGAQGIQGPQGAQGPQGPAGTPAPTFNFSAPSARTLVVSTAYQATDPAKAAVITVSPQCTAALTLVTGSTCSMQARVGAAGLTCSTGTPVLQWVNGNTGALTVGLALNQIVGAPGDVKLPIGAYFILCPTAGTFTINTAVDQSAG